ncbi:MAG: hypothetical protein Q9214_004898 [Letrouitia sp. 1 TL-2023]
MSLRTKEQGKNASSEFEEVSHEVVALHTPIKELEDEARDPTSALSRAGSSRCKELSELLQNCKSVLTKLDTLLVKYQRLGTQSRRTAINLFLTSLGTDTLGRIERKVDEIVREIKAGKREPTLLSVSDEEDPTGAERKWDALKGELLEEGLTKPEVEAHRLAIRAKIQEAIDSAEIHDADGTHSAQSAVGSFSPHTLKEKQTEVVYQSRVNLEQRLASEYHSASEMSGSQKKAQQQVRCLIR